MDTQKCAEKSCKPAAQERKDRLAGALRSNLARRKTQKRTREETKSAPLDNRVDQASEEN